MLFLRMVEEAIAERYAEQEMRCPVHLSVGQEAAAAGVCEALRITDHAFSTHRCHAHYLMKGGDLYRRPLTRAEMIAPLAWHETQLARVHRYGERADGSIGFECVK